MDPWERITSGGRVASRRAKEAIRFEIAPVGDGSRGHQLLVFVDEVEMTSKGAGMGMDPFDVLLPHNRLIATEQPVRVPIARCECGEYGCSSTDVSILRDGDVVHWDWLIDVPTGHGATFRADQYDAEVTRVGSDHRWERPQDTTARLILGGADRHSLAEHGLLISWAAPDHRDDSRFVVSLMTTDERFQVFLRVGRAGKPPEVVSAEMLALLARAPSTWPATYTAIQIGWNSRPAMAGWRWRRQDVGSL